MSHFLGKRGCFLEETKKFLEEMCYSLKKTVFFLKKIICFPKKITHFLGKMGYFLKETPCFLQKMAILQRLSLLIMPREYLPGTDTGKINWLNNLAAKLPGYAAKYGISAAEQADVAATAADWAYRCDWANKITNYKKGVVKWKIALRDGEKTAGITLTPPAPPVPGTPPPATAPGGFGRMADIVNRIKSHDSYVKADGINMGIEGPREDAPDLSEMKPRIKQKPGTAGHPRFSWKRGKMSGVNVYKDAGDGAGFQFYARRSQPRFEDQAALPEQGAKWQYKFIYVLGDEEVGQFSDVVTVYVGQ